MSVVIPSLRGAIAVPGWAKNELWRRARAVPSLDLRFADNKSLVDAVTGASLITFTRASDGTFVDSAGVLQTAATDVPRFDHNPITGESLGLLVEEQRTNLIVQSENLGTTWVTTGLLAFGSGSTLNATVAPDGATTADLVTENSSTSEHRVATASISWAASTTYTLTMFAKANGRTRMDIFGVGGANFTGGRNVSFNLSTGAVIATDGAVASIEPRANGWYRVRMTFTASAAPSASQIFIRFLDNSSNFSYTGDGTSGIFLWGAQLEAGAFPTSYIPTTTAAVTRSADVASIGSSAFSGWYRQDEGTVFSDASMYAGAGSLNRDAYIFLNTATPNSDFIREWSWSGNPLTLFHSVYTSSSGPIAADFTISRPSAYKSAFAVASNNYARSINGGSLVTDAAGNMPVGVDQVIIGRTMNGTIRRLTYWPQRLANSTLQTLTQ